MYYLQSRYYNPTLGRFINADALASTGQDILGNNMFAYCLNNPVNRIDTAGTVSLWFYLVVDHDMGFVHRMVVAHIKENYGVDTEVVLSAYGRADVVSEGFVWEVKHQGTVKAARIAQATLQALSYRDNNAEITALGSAGYFNGTFVISCEGSYYTVEYSTPTSGVILYTVKETTENSNLNAQYHYQPKEKNQYTTHQMNYLPNPHIPRTAMAVGGFVGAAFLAVYCMNGDLSIR